MAQYLEVEDFLRKAGVFRNISSNSQDMNMPGGNAACAAESLQDGTAETRHTPDSGNTTAVKEPARFSDNVKACSMEQAVLPVIDVRSPSEYAHAHIPGAISMPLFDDEERAEVGTIYKKQSKVKAVQRGLEFVGPKMADFTRQALRLKSPEILLHCWRGGMRSASMAWLLETVGLKVYLLKDGYKAYRNYVLKYFERDFNLVNLGGCTGAGKTDILAALKAHGEQVIDLEGLACHKGSAFGAIGQAPQPSTEYFEHLLFNELLSMDPNRRIWIEDESRNVGKIFLPAPFFETLRKAPLVKIDTSYEVRLARLMRDYTNFDTDILCASIRKVEKRLGYEKAAAAIKCCESGDMEGAVRICLAYYDKLYNSSLEKRYGDGRNYVNFPVETLDVESIVADLIDTATCL